MEIKKITIFLLVTVLLLFPFLSSCDFTQYKRIGDTNFYLYEDIHGNALLYHNEGRKRPSYAISHEGIVSDVYWNQKYIIVKCCQSDNDTIKYWYVMKNKKEYVWKEFEIKVFNNIIDYEMAIDSMGLSEEHMEYTDGSIPWRIHL